MRQIMEGSHAVAEAVRLCRPGVISAYPITPQTHIVERLAEMVANGECDADYITVESEFSALSSCLGASAAGSRTYSATTSQGLAFMFEVCFNVAGMRQPVIMSIANRAMGAPLSIWNDQQDSISLRDAGWFQLYAEDAQESMDLHFLAYRIAEDHRVLLPGFVCFDGFILSHTYEPVDVPPQDGIDAFLPPFKPFNVLDAKNPISMGMYATPDYYMEFRYQMDQAMDQAAKVMAEAGREFSERFGRDYGGLVEEYRLDDADVAFVAMGSVCGTVKDAIDEMRAAGVKAGLLKLRSFRPFPKADIRRALAGVAAVAVLEKNISIGSAMKGAAGPEVKDALYGTGINVYSYIIGLGGRDVRKKDIAAIAKAAAAQQGDMFYGLRTELV
ncbi:MAG: pyruvate ferredoxin oxidoreductase [Methanomicrobiales archaeon]|nr:pyruvate ferredoxin oxidoreductase [Methanomicrobiales archaeon]